MRTSLYATAALLCVSVTIAAAGELEDGFTNPPNTARPWVYWTCQDGHYSNEGATRDLEALKKAGVGGILRMDCTVPRIPYGGTPFLSDKWRQHFVHTIHECERLGLEFCTITGPGWTGTGGPWIKAEQSMQHLVPATVTAKGPAKFNQVLPIPQPRISPYHRKQTSQMKKAIGTFYKDEFVLAFPSRKPVIGDISEKALFIRNPYTSKRGVRPCLPSPASYPAAAEGQVIDPKSIVDLTDKLQADGRLVWDVPEGEWTIVRLSVRSTGANTRPAPSAGLGLESDKFSKQALETHFKAYFDPLLKAIGSRPRDRTTGFVALDADSWEMSSQNWTPGFRDEFKKRRGYDPRLYFAAYTGCVVGSREETERFLWDVRKTCQELLLENHAAELQRHCHQRGLRLMIEPYDMNPAGDLDLGSYADYPAGEFWITNFKSGWSCVAAASIAHTMGKPIVLAETFTSTGNWWARSPWTLKNQTDCAFALGINRFAIHGFAHQSDERAPGFTFGPYGVFWNRKQTFWPLIGAYHKYLARCSYLLQQGVTVSDILYLTPEGTPQVFQPPASALHEADGWVPDKKGYTFDGCSPRILMDRAVVKDGLIAFPGGTSYRLLVLPRWQTMTPQLLTRIGELVKAGATVVGSPPLKSPSLSNYPTCDKELKNIAQELWGSFEEPAGVTRHKYGDGSIWWGGGISKPAKDLYTHYDLTASILKKMGIPEDLATEGPIRHTHRRTDTHEIYFVSNRTANPVDAECTFRVGSGKPQLWNPVTGTVRRLEKYKQADGRITIPLKFFAHQGYFVIFSKEKGGEENLLKENFAETNPLQPIDGAWEVAFDPKWGGPEKVTFDKLHDWTQSNNAGIKYYSGMATYRKTFDVPKVPSERVYLELGTVHVMARVRLNGKNLGVVWCAPWRVDVSKALEAGKNELEIEVVNLWPNRMIGDAGKPVAQRIARPVIPNPYKANHKLLPSGLLGPVRLMTAKGNTTGAVR